MQDILTAENTEWSRNFRRRNGRLPRILHIGNIANNAYNNAKLLIQAGFDCDVLCYDYYHSMGCPEWEDADFNGTLGDNFSPDWWRHDLGSFRRPQWFAQGPLWLCLDYLLARRRGQGLNAWLCWLRLGQFNQTLRGHARHYALGILSRLQNVFRHRVLSVLQMPAGRAYKTLALRVFGFFVGAPVGVLLATLAMPLWWLMRRVDEFFKRTTGAAETIGEFDRRCDALIREWSLEFPKSADPLQRSDFPIVRELIPIWACLLAEYDFVIGYSTDPIHPLLLGKPYFAFEHGTIREIPYQRTPQGRCAALSYRRAVHVFVTNFDCRQSARQLAPGRYTLINHPYDEDRGLLVCGWEEARAELSRELRCEFLCFFPTRHDWVAGTGYADKANDIFLQAIVQLKGRGIRIGVVCCRWGSNVEQSQTLLAELGIADQVKWEAPMAMMKFERTARASDVVVDQFKLGSFGGIVFKAMAVGAPVLTYLDESQLVEQYPEVPPVINCATTHDVVEKLSHLYADRDALAQLRAASMQWIRKHHGKRETVNRQVDQFRALYAAEATTIKETG